MKRISMVVIATVLLLAPHIATAKDFCFDIGGPALLVFKDFSVPGKGNCMDIRLMKPSPCSLSDV